MSTLALPSQGGEERFIESYSRNNDYDNDEGMVALEDLEEASSSDVSADDWVPKKMSGQL